MKAQYEEIALERQEKEKEHVQTTPSSTHRKSSVFGLSLLKGSSSRRSLHSDKEKSDAKSAKEEARAAKEAEKERHKKEDKDRSESRISVLMGRKRGKVSCCDDLVVRRRTLIWTISCRHCPLYNQGRRSHPLPCLQ